MCVAWGRQAISSRELGNSSSIQRKLILVDWLEQVWDGGKVGLVEGKAYTCRYLLLRTLFSFLFWRNPFQGEFFHLNQTTTPQPDYSPRALINPFKLTCWPRRAGRQISRHYGNILLRSATYYTYLPTYMHTNQTTCIHAYIHTSCTVGALLPTCSLGAEHYYITWSDLCTVYINIRKTAFRFHQRNE